MYVAGIILLLSAFSFNTNPDISLELAEEITLAENKLSTSSTGPFSAFLFLDDYFVNYTTSPQKIMLYDYEGSQKRTVGGPGDGPGEYGTIHDLFLKDDHIVAFNEGGRVLKFNMNGEVEEEFSYQALDPLKSVISDGVVYFIESNFQNEYHIQYEYPERGEQGEFFSDLTREDIWLRSGHYGDNLSLSRDDCLVWVPPAQRNLYHSCNRGEDIEQFEFESEHYRNEELTASDDELIQDNGILNDFVTNRSAATTMHELEDKWVVEIYHNHIPNIELILLDDAFDQIGNITLDEEFRSRYGGSVGSEGNTLYFYYEDEGENGELIKNLHGYRITD